MIAHEVGHHIQNQLGILGRFNEARRRMSERDANAMSVRVELQADCLAGVWGHDAAARGLLERGDLDEALNAASQIGDDTMQRRAQGYVVPESFRTGRRNSACAGSASVSKAAIWANVTHSRLGPCRDGLLGWFEKDRQLANVVAA